MSACLARSSAQPGPHPLSGFRLSATPRGAVSTVPHAVAAALGNAGQAKGQTLLALWAPSKQLPGRAASSRYFGDGKLHTHRHIDALPLLPPPPGLSIFVFSTVWCLFAPATGVLAGYPKVTLHGRESCARLGVNRGQADLGAGERGASPSNGLARGPTSTPDNHSRLDLSI